MTLKCRRECLKPEFLNLSPQINSDIWSVCDVCKFKFDRIHQRCLCCGTVLKPVNAITEKGKAEPKLNNDEWVKAMHGFLNEKLIERKGSGLTGIEDGILLDFLDEVVKN